MFSDHCGAREAINDRKTDGNMEFEQKDQLIEKLADVAKVKSHINKDLYTKYNVKRGIRNNDGTGVLVGLTEVGEVMSYIVDDADRIPVEGKLFYQGYGVKDLVNGFFSEGRYGYEETAEIISPHLVL